MRVFIVQVTDIHLYYNASSHAISQSKQQLVFFQPGPDHLPLIANATVLFSVLAVVS